MQNIWHIVVDILVPALSDPQIFVSGATLKLHLVAALILLVGAGTAYYFTPALYTLFDAGTVYIV